MRNRAARIVLVLLVVAAQGAAGYFLYQTETQLAATRDLAAAFEADAVRLQLRLKDLGSAQQAYVAAGQGEEYWTGRATTLLQDAEARLKKLEQRAIAADGRASLATTAEVLTNFRALDAKVRESLRAAPPLAAADLIFADGREQLAACAAGIDAARNVEASLAQARVNRLRWLETYDGGGAALLSLVALLLLLPYGRRAEVAPVSAPRRVSPPPAETDVRARAALEAIDLDLRPTARPSVRPTPPAAPPRPQPASPPGPARPAPAAPDVDLAATARLCRDLATANDTNEVQQLLEGAARLLDASGLIVWMAADAGHLRPVLSHGYSPQVLAKLGALPSEAENAVSSAFRNGRLEVVRGDHGAPGAIAVPLPSSAGCTGVLAAEVRGGRETNTNVQALAAIIAAQIAMLVTPQPETTNAGTEAGDRTGP